MAGHLIGTVKDNPSVALTEPKPKVAPIETKDFVVRRKFYENVVL